MSWLVRFPSNVVTVWPSGTRTFLHFVYASLLCEQFSEGQKEVVAPFLFVVRGAVELFWHSLLFGFVQVTDSPALEVM